MSKRSPVASSLSRRLLGKFNGPERLGEAEADLQEVYRRELERGGSVRAHLRFWKEALAIAFWGWRGDRPDPPRSRRRGPGGIVADLATDVRLALRRIVQSPGFSAVAVLTLALGIGANSAIFSLVKGVLLNPLPYPEADRLVNIWHRAPGLGLDQFEQSEATYLTYRAARSFDQVAGVREGGATLTGIDEPRRVRVGRVTANLFETLRVPALLGRGFVPDDGEPGAAPVVAISHQLWTELFGADREAIGADILIDGTAHEIVAVLAPDLNFPERQTQLLIPLPINSVEPRVSGFNFDAIGRLADGVTIEQARAELSSLLGQIHERYETVFFSPDNIETAGLDVFLKTRKSDEVGDIGRILWILLGTVGFVLLLASANVANLFLVRAEGRQREVAVRVSLGASRGAIARFYLVESVVLGMLGGIAGVVLADVGLGVLASLGTGLVPRLWEVRIDGGVLLFSLAISMVAGLCFGIYPLLHAYRADVAGRLNEGGRGAVASRRGNRARNVLVVAQVAIALVLLVGAGLMVRTFQKLTSVDPGFDPDNMLTVSLSLPANDYETVEEVAGFYLELVERVEALPGVEAAAVASVLPMVHSGNNWTMHAEGVEVSEGGVADFMMVRFASPGYFRTLGIPLQTGRGFEPADHEVPNLVTVVSESAANKYWPGEDPIGKRLRSDSEGDWYTVVGVARDIHNAGLHRPPSAMTYWSIAGMGFAGTIRQMSLAVRTEGDPMVLSGAVRGEIRTLDRSLAVINVRTMETIVGNTVSRTTFATTMLAIAAGVALLLASIGIYGVISYVVSEHTREIGVRMALGATRRVVSRQVVAGACRLAVVGVVLGLAGAIGLARFLSAILFDVSPYDPLTLSAVASFLLGVALLASVVPAWRAARVDPSVAMRTE